MLACLQADRGKIGAACNKILLSHGQWRRGFLAGVASGDTVKVFLGTMSQVLR